MTDATPEIEAQGGSPQSLPRAGDETTPTSRAQLQIICVESSRSTSTRANAQEAWAAHQRGVAG